MSGLCLHLLVYILAAWMGRRQYDVVAYLCEENRVLREQLDHFRAGRRLRFSVAQRRRLAACAKALGHAMLSAIPTLVTPDTLLRWYRELVARKYDGSKKRGVGRPPLSSEHRALVLRLATENPTWGYSRIRGALRQLKVVLARSTIRRILREAGIEPAQLRGQKTTWREFLEAHWGVIAATDFFTVEVLTPSGLVRYAVLFVIDLETRRVHLAGIVHDPGRAWVEQVARNLTDAVDGVLLGTRYLIHDRDPLFCAGFRDILRAGGVGTVRLPAHSPNLNAFAERFVLSIRRECLDRIIPLSEKHLRCVVTEYLAHYNAERPHQGVGNVLLTPPLGVPANDNGPIQCRKRLGGLLRYYHRDAA